MTAGVTVRFTSPIYFLSGVVSSLLYFFFCVCSQLCFQTRHGGVHVLAVWTWLSKVSTVLSHCFTCNAKLTTRSGPTTSPTVTVAHVHSYHSTIHNINKSTINQLLLLLYIIYYYYIKYYYILYYNIVIYYHWSILSILLKHGKTND